MCRTCAVGVVKGVDSIADGKEKTPEKACKPGPVSRARARPDDHFSRAPVTRRLKRPYPRAPRGPRSTRAPGFGPDAGIALLFDLAPGGVYRAGAVTRAAGELLPHRFTLTARWIPRGGLLSVALVRGVAPPGR